MHTLVLQAVSNSSSDLRVFQATLNINLRSSVNQILTARICSLNASFPLAVHPNHSLAWKKLGQESRAPLETSRCIANFHASGSPNALPSHLLAPSLLSQTPQSKDVPMRGKPRSEIRLLVLSLHASLESAFWNLSFNLPPPRFSPLPDV